jgi:uncharacterized protein
MSNWLMRLRWPLAVLAMLAYALMPAGAYALEVPPAPSDIPIVDQTGTLTEEQKQALATKIAKERTETGNQIAVLMVRSLDGEALEDYSLAVARGWRIGQKERNSGVLLLVAKDDHKLRIEVGYGLEGALPDVRASHIIQDRITPQFKQGKFYEGIDSGLDGIVAAIHGEKDPNLNSGSAKPAWTSWIEPVLFGGVFVIIWLGSILARTKSWWAGGVIGGVGGVVVGVVFGFLFVGLVAIPILALLGLLFDKLVSDNYRKAASGNRNRPSWWAGGPWIGGGGIGGNSSGGFGGFSGGSFGGGGSSGSW